MLIIKKQSFCNIFYKDDNFKNSFEKELNQHNFFGKVIKNLIIDALTEVHF